MKVLVVEDNETNRLVARLMLEKIGHRVSQTAGGREAIERMRSETFDLVLMDLQMPEMDGHEATGRIRSGEAGNKNRHIPIIAITANVMPHDRDSCIQSGMNYHLSKPIIIEEMKKAIAAATQGEPETP